MPKLVTDLLSFASWGLLGCFVFLAAPNCSAEVISIEVEVKAVNIDKRTIIAERNGKRLELSVAKSSRFSVNGNQIEFSNLPVNQSATLKYETKLEVVVGVESNQVADLSRFRVVLDKDGRLRIWVNGEDAPNVAERQPVEIEAFGDADVAKLEDGRLAVGYDFSKEGHAGFPVGSEDILSVDDEHGAALLMPGEKRPNELLLAKPILDGFEVRLDFVGSDKGTFQFLVRSGDEIVAVSVYGRDASNNDVGSSVVSIRKRGQWRTLSRFPVVATMEKPVEVQLGSALVGNRKQLSLGLIGDEPKGIKKILAVGRFPSSFGAQLGERGKNVLVVRIVEDSASDGALRVGDVLEEVNGVKISGLKNALESLGKCQIGETAELTVRRLGKSTTVAVTPR